jgi:large subunit ribosomal protein L25
MENSSLLKAEIRENTGTGSAAAVRKKGQVPAIIYGHKKTPMAITLNTHDLTEQLHRGQRLIDVQIDKATEKLIVKAVQYDHLGKNIIHLDLMRVNVTERIKVDVPIQIKGTAKGTLEGGVVSSQVSKLEVECAAINIPEAIVINIKEIGVGDSIHAKDVVLPEGVKLISNPEMLLVSCSTVEEPKTTEEIEAEAPAAPEVITEVKREERAAAAEEESK